MTDRDQWRLDRRVATVDCGKRLTKEQKQAVAKSLPPGVSVADVWTIIAGDINPATGTKYEQTKTFITLHSPAFAPVGLGYAPPLYTA